MVATAGTPVAAAEVVRHKIDKVEVGSCDGEVNVLKN